MAWRQLNETINAKITYYPDKWKRGNRGLAVDDRHRYRLLKLITKDGASGEVFVARDKSTMANVVVKRAKKKVEHEIDAERANYDHIGVHPNIMPMVAYFKDAKQRPCLVLPLMEKTLGDFLDARKAEGKMTTHEESAVMMFQLLRGLNKVHTVGRIHRDTKPDNIFLRGRRLFIGDFGSCDEEGDINNAYIVTRQYRPPEAAFGNVPYSMKLDMWSAGAIFTEMLTGSVVFQAESNAALKSKICAMIGNPTQAEWDAILPPGEAIPADLDGRMEGKLHQLLTTAAVSRDAIKLIERMLVFDPAKRPSALRAMASPFFNIIRGNVKHAWLLEGWTVSELASHDQHLVQQAVPMDFWTPDVRAHFTTTGQQRPQA